MIYALFAVYTILVFLAGGILAFLFYGRYDWRSYLNRMIPAHTVGYLATVLKELVEEGILTDNQATEFEKRLMTKEIQEQMQDNWAEEHLAAHYGQQDKMFDKALDATKRDLRG